MWGRFQETLMEGAKKEDGWPETTPRNLWSVYINQQLTCNWGVSRGSEWWCFVSLFDQSDADTKPLYSVSLLRSCLKPKLFLLLRENIKPHTLSDPRPFETRLSLYINCDLLWYYKVLHVYYMLYLYSYVIFSLNKIISLNVCKRLVMR